MSQIIAAAHRPDHGLDKQSLVDPVSAVLVHFYYTLLCKADRDLHADKYIVVDPVF